ncbi:helix-turn-helix domain-containing protein [Gluconobacter wancherniae]|uniref:helix-turn-helix domain-containing protein n=1 Tax=Gluconobacter wancherniae TaxID=1307955 RepID=UPI0020127582|nr:helix-turn-helix transcriptional regulator [Gluconobacter wancherniae]
MWKPADPSRPSRQILDLLEDMVSFDTLSSEKGKIDDHYVISQSLFRKWVRENDAKLLQNEGSKASPAAELAKKITTLRKACNTTQQELAESLGISRSAVAFMETGRTSSARKHIPNLAKIFQVPVEFFLSGMVEQETTMVLSNDEKDLIDLYRRLPAELKINIQKYAERQTRKAALGF